MKTLSPSQYLFVEWLAKNHPALYDAASAQTLGAVGDNAAAIFQNVMANANSLLSQYVQGKQQVAEFKERVALVKYGNQRFPEPARSGVPQWVWIGGAVVVAALILSRK